ncbi:transcriptional repressor, CopY family protein [Paenibacillus vortex V453]|jgi:BlaI family penicillinase repressor|uniref:Transcriptional repressor, CopY family protein n=1 Tax=Paenibacillus vortex V453 TaxID=715225 RepID=A0A2R9STZ1_9BACL|nr:MULTISPECIES: BlaI/MecI/CopY family transcriptional regulator [Paenibacillus]MCA4752328.1 BlaI/MecI/CopY family transcriptional regulator [Mycolicibacterium fortuitum]AVV58289.1 BlaI/MecI/CopY family transcriptional regulator [Paenibacillus glucanolyticus]EFU40791.1 transcriptional repressor, CopY family protein [Paenibacillus vortex V453]ETT42503.1 CopY family transcriptional repressor [Paenibacillus sp. FSL R5-808]MPY17627.1 BlaI/MecI/CopY family transcriptional regulator [Paenibacillus g
MNHIPPITEAELEIMRVLWTNPNSPSSHVVQQMTERMEWSPNTTRTLLSRLVQKEAAGAKPGTNSKRTQLFYPLISEQEYLRSETKSFMKKLYGGALHPMLANFLKDKKLNAQEIEDLKALFDENGSCGEAEKRDT